MADSPSLACPPVLFVVFNRPDLAGRVFEAIRQARPARLFIAGDGPRPGRIGEAELCEQCRALAGRVDWPCEVKARFLPENVGCKAGVSGAISWFFEHVEEGIILEDDCLPHPSFFSYCAALLALYRADARVGLISGNNFFPENEWRGEGYDFSLFTSIWGWATWRRAWDKFDGRLLDWPRWRRSPWLAQLLGSEHAAESWKPYWDRCYSGKLDSWAFPWCYCCWRAGFLSVVPPCNLVTNIGFDERGTHTKDADSRHAEVNIRAVATPTTALPVRRNMANDARYLKVVYSIGEPAKRQKRGWRVRWRAFRARMALRLDAWLLGVSSRRAKLRRTLRLLLAADSPVGGEVTLEGRQWRYLDAVAFVRDYDQIFRQGLYLLPDRVSVRRVIDCGAGDGLVALHFAGRYPDAEVIALESDPQRQESLAANLARAKTGRVRVLQESLVGEKDAKGVRKTTGLSLAALVNGEAVDLLRLDLRGSECDVLIGQVEVLRVVSCISVEYYAGLDHRRRLPELLGTLRDAGFLVQLQSVQVTSRPYLWPADEMELDHRIRIFGRRA